MFELCGTSDDEQSRIISNIFSLYEPKRIWKFVNYVSGLSPEDRRSRRASLRTVCYILGKIGQTDTKRALRILKLLLSDDHMLRSPALAALSNLWVLDTRATANILLKSWILAGEENDDLQEISVRSAEYLASEQPELVRRFLLRVSKLQHRAKISARIAEQLIETYASSKRSRKSQNLRRANKRRLKYKKRKK